MSQSARPKTIVTIFGTRPEATKMAPVVHAIAADPALRGVVVVTGQHREQLDDALRDVDISVDHDLDLMKPNQSVDALVAGVISEAGQLWAEIRPDLVIVHGDTGTTCASALSAFYNRIPVGHVEAGLRSGSLKEPFPEEGNRRVVDTLADLLFAPTEGARAHLLREGHDDQKIVVTGNTAIDTLRLYVDKARATRVPALDELAASSRMVLVTAHRRESFGDAFRELCIGLKRIVDETPGVEIIYPVHLNPNVRKPVFEILGDDKRIHLIEPLSYLQFMRLMDRSEIIVTDSGGIQEEAPQFGKPVLVMRERTERPEALEAGTALLVGTSADRIAGEARRLLTDRAHYDRMARAINPFGDGYAAQRIVAKIKDFFAIA
jgi:UDP-N-acetylglucosamine 2-epimerase (non-hydrolysing)